MPPTLIKITAMKVKMVGRRVRIGAIRAIFASDLSYNITKHLSKIVAGFGVSKPNCCADFK
jgi:hypothetical protein